MVAILSNQREVILEAVRAMYTDVAMEPQKGFHFPTGRAACDLVGYTSRQLDELPGTAVESFAGVGCPFRANVIRAGDVVLDVGAGSGTDALIAAALVGPHGRVIALDLTAAMRQKLRQNLERAGAGNVESLEGHAEQIPLPDESVDVVTTNGVINLVPDKQRAFAEIRRVLRPGGRLQLADIVVGTLPSPACRSKPELWAECIVGATREDDYTGMLEALGFDGVEIIDRIDYFAASANEETRKVAASFGAQAIVLRATLGWR